MSDSNYKSALSTRKTTGEALEEVIETVQPVPDGNTLGLLFVSPHHGPDFTEPVETIYDRTGVDLLTGCRAEGIIGNGREIEDEPAVSLWIANRPGEDLEPLRIQFKQSPDSDAFTGIPDDDRFEENCGILLFGDPFTFPANEFLNEMNKRHAGVPVMGGMASGSNQPGQNTLFLNDQEYREGAAGAILSGVKPFSSLVSQGCKPIGPEMIVTSAEEHVIKSLGGESPLSRLQNILEHLSPEERTLAQEGLHIGVVIDEQQEEFSRGDFLIRSVMGVDQDSGAIQVGVPIRPGRTVQFHVRDAESADRDLRKLLSGLSDKQKNRIRGTLLFTCNGRGTHLFSEPNHDAAMIQEVLGDVPTAGFFAQGELGPVGGENFMHGYTASIALFE